MVNKRKMNRQSIVLDDSGRPALMVHPNCWVEFYNSCYNKPMRCRFCIRNGNTFKNGSPTFNSDFYITPPKEESPKED
jgi:hypothetical protein